MTKKLLLGIAFLLCNVGVSAQDVLVTNDGESLKVYNLEIGPSTIYYQLSDEANADIKRIDKSDVLIIRKADGTKIDPNTDKNVINVNNTQLSDNSNTALPQLVEKAPDAKNQDIIALYNHDCQSTGQKLFKEDDKPAKLGYLIYWVSPSSLMSNDEVEISFVKKFWEDVWDFYVIVIKNKTNNFIYIDLANCFRTCSSGDVRCYYENEQTTVSQGSSSGGSVGLGAVAGALGVGGVIGQVANGVSVGGGSSASVSTTYSSQRIISIPPKGQRNLTDLKMVKVKGNMYKTVSEAENFNKLKTDLKGKLSAGEHFFNESNTPFTIDYNITYSTSEDFSTYSIVHSKLFLRGIIGSKHSFASSGWSLDGHADNVGKYLSGITDNSIIGIQSEF